MGQTENPAAKEKTSLRCHESWRRFAPDFRLQRWDESNFDVDSLEYTAQAFRLRKYAFVSDVARLHALLSEGGIYLDTDVELLKTPDSLLSHGATIGGEQSGPPGLFLQLSYHLKKTTRCSGNFSTHMAGHHLSVRAHGPT